MNLPLGAAAFFMALKATCALEASLSTGLTGTIGGKKLIHGHFHPNADILCSNVQFLTPLLSCQSPVDGNIFEIKTKDYPVSIERIDVHMAATTVPIAVWYRPDNQSPVYVETYQNAIDTDITGNGQGVLTPLPAFDSPIVLEAQSTYTFYITASKNGVEALYYGMGTELGKTFVSDDFLDVTEGYAMRYSFSSPAFPRQWNGECRI